MPRYIWWLSQPEMEAMGRDVPDLPNRLRFEFQSMWGRPLRGRLWGEGEVAPEHFESVFGRYLSRCGGIVVETAELPSLRGALGVVTDFELRRVER